MARTYTEEELAERLRETAGWTYQNGEITRTFEFETFPEAIDFVTEVAIEAERSEHHPDIDIRYTKVRLGLVSHEAGGVTDKDLTMALRVNNLA